LASGHALSVFSDIAQALLENTKVARIRNIFTLRIAKPPLLDRAANHYRAETAIGTGGYWLLASRLLIIWRRNSGGHRKNIIEQKKCLVVPYVTDIIDNS
jgi:hypothetical protein